MEGNYAVLYGISWVWPLAYGEIIKEDKRFLHVKIGEHVAGGGNKNSVWFKAACLIFITLEEAESAYGINGNLL